MEQIEQAEVALDELIDVLGRATVEMVLHRRRGLPAHRNPGKKGGAVGWHGREKGMVCLKERKLRVKRPRLRKKGQGEDGEVPIPAYEAMRSDEKLGSWMWRSCCAAGRSDPAESTLVDGFRLRQPVRRAEDAELEHRG